MVERCHGLSRMDRQILIMIDGRRTLGELAQLVPHADHEHVVAKLLDEEFVM